MRYFLLTGIIAILLLSVVACHSSAQRDFLLPTAPEFNEAAGISITDPAMAGGPIIFDALLSAGGIGDLTFTWDDGDDDSGTFLSQMDGPSGSTASWTGPDGTYELACTVTDEAGNSDTILLQISVVSGLARAFLALKPGYVGTERCLTCHYDDISEEMFFSHPHQMSQRAPDDPLGPGLVADWSGTISVTGADGANGEVALEREGSNFTAVIADREFAVARLYGGVNAQYDLWKQRYIVEIGNSDYILPVQWNSATSEWVSYHAENWFDSSGALIVESLENAAWERRCAGCHETNFTVDFNSLTGEWMDVYDDINTSCERCHGPGSAHVDAPGPDTILGPTAFSSWDWETRNSVCGQCHNRGSSTATVNGTTFGFPYLPGVGEFVPGNDLGEYFVEVNPVDNASRFWSRAVPVGDAMVHPSKSHRQQWIDMKNGYHGGVLDCWSCHSPHGPIDRGRTNAEWNQLCTSCHSSVGYTSHTRHSSEDTGPKCVNCHMPYMAKSAVAYDIRSHLFSGISPTETLAMLDEGSAEPMPNSCMDSGCHGGQAALTDRGELELRGTLFEIWFGD